MAESYHPLFADSAEAPDRDGFMPPLVRWPIASASTHCRLHAAG
jgi:hypothetical protein